MENSQESKETNFQEELEISRVEGRAPKPKIQLRDTRLCIPPKCVEGSSPYLVFRSGFEK